MSDSIGKFIVPAGGTVVALGNFDGVHLGHLTVLRETVRLAREQHAQPCAAVFKTHPMQSLRGGAPPMLLTPALRDKVFEQTGIEAVYPLEFEAIRDMEPAVFVEQVLVGRLHAHAVCCGYNYHFGRGGSGDASRLREACTPFGVAVHTLPEVDFAGGPVSSTRIRAAVEQGEAELAAALLGRPFSYDFTVVGGDRRGRLLGFPTINQYFPDGYAVPRFGVYASRTFVEGKWHASVTNVGLRPTIGTESLRSETCILDFSGDLYGKNIEVGLLRFLRPEKKFDSLEALTAQIAQNSKAAKEIFEELHHGEF